MLKKVRQSLLVIACILACTVLSSCTIGIKEKNTLVFVSPVPIPDAAKGIVVIATNKPIPLSIMDSPELKFSRDVGGYVLVDPGFYGKLIDTWNNR